MTIPTFESYGDYSSDNYGAHSLKFTDARGDCYWFSYKTLVAFCIKGEKVVHTNDWKTTTGKHLNWIDDGDKKSRVDDATFNLLLRNATLCAA